MVVPGAMGLRLGEHQWKVGNLFLRSIEIGEGWTGVLHGELEHGSAMAGDNGGLGGRKGLRPAPFIDATRGG